MATATKKPFNAGPVEKSQKAAAKPAPAKAASKPVCEVGDWLKRQGFVKVDYVTVKLGELFVIKPRSECPWWTVQKRSSTTVRWFVDFDAKVPASAICKFIESV